MSCLEKDEDCLLHMLIEQFRCEYKCYINIGVQEGGVGVGVGVGVVGVGDAVANTLVRANSEPCCISLKKTGTGTGTGTGTETETTLSDKEKKDKIIDEIIALQDKYTDLCHFQTALIENNVSCKTTSNSQNILSTVALVIEAICSEIQSKNNEFTELPKESKE